MAVEVGAAVLQQHVGEVVEAALGGDAGLELADGAGGGVARIGKSGQALLLAVFVHFLESRQRHEQFAADFEIWRNPGFLQLSIGMESGMERTVRTLSVTSSPMVPSPRVMPRTSLPSLVEQGQRHAVELQFADIVDVFAAAEFVDAAFPVAQLVFAVSIVEREHGRGVRRFDEALARLAADALGGRVGRDQFRMLSFELLELVHELVEFGVANFRIVEHVVAIFVMADFFAQRFDLLFDLLARWPWLRIIFGSRQGLCGAACVAGRTGPRTVDSLTSKRRRRLSTAAGGCLASSIK